MNDSLNSKERTLIAIPGYRDPFFDTRNEVRSQDDEQRHREHFLWLEQSVESLQKDRKLPDGIQEGPILTAIKALMDRGNKVTQVILLHSDESRIEYRTKGLIKCLNVAIQNLNVKSVKILQEEESHGAFLYDNAYNALAETWQNIMEASENHPPIALLGPSTPQLNLGLAVCATQSIDQVELVQVLTPRFHTDSLLRNVKFDGKIGADLRNRKEEIRKLRSEINDLQLQLKRKAPSANLSSFSVPIKDMVADFEKDLWVQVIQKARENHATNGSKVTLTAIAKLAGCSRQNVTQRLKALDLDELS